MILGRRHMKARYIEIKDDVLAKINDGTYAPGQTIPTEQELAQIYGVSRPTIRQALQILVNSGYLDKRKRRGTIVTEPKIAQGFATRMRSFEDEMRSVNRIARTMVIMCDSVSADAEVAGALEVGEGTEVLKLIRVRYADSLPNVIVVTYVPLSVFPGIQHTDFTHESLYVTMRLMGNPVVRANRRLDVACADSGTAAVLNMDEGDPVFVFHTVARDAHDRACEYSIATYRGETNTFEFTTEILASEAQAQ